MLWTIQRFVAGETFGRKSRRVGKRNTFSALANLVRSRSFRQLCNICYWINFTIVWPCIVTNTLWIKPTDALNFSFIGITTLHVSGSLSAHHQELLAVNRLWYILCSCDRLLPGVGWNCQTNRCTEFHSYWYYDSTCFGQPFCPSSGVLSRTSALVHLMQLWWPFATRSRMELPETCWVVIPVKLQFSASVGLVHKESETSHIPDSLKFNCVAKKPIM